MEIWDEREREREREKERGREREREISHVVIEKTLRVERGIKNQ